MEDPGSPILEVAPCCSRGSCQLSCVLVLLVGNQGFLPLGFTGLPLGFLPVNRLATYYNGSWKHWPKAPDEAAAPEWLRHMLDAENTQSEPGSAYGVSDRLRRYPFVD